MQKLHFAGSFYKKEIAFFLWQWYNCNIKLKRKRENEKNRP